MKPFLAAEPEQLVLEPIPLGRTLFAGDYTSAARRLHREPLLRRELQRQRAIAAGALKLSAPMRAQYLGQITKSTVGISSYTPRLQCLNENSVALADNRWLRTHELPDVASRLAIPVLSWMGLPSDAALDNFRPSAGQLVGSVAQRSTGWEIVGPDDTAATSLVTLLHEIGHFLYETSPQALPEGTLGRYVVSETFALALGWYGFEAYLRLSHHQCEDLQRWRELRRSESWLNDFYFLSECSDLGLYEAPEPDIEKLYLKRTYAESVGYQLVYALADSAAQSQAYAQNQGRNMAGMLT